MLIKELVEELKKLDGNLPVYLYKYPENKYSDETVEMNFIEIAYDNVGKCIILDEEE